MRYATFIFLFHLDFRVQSTYNIALSVEHLSLIRQALDFLQLSLLSAPQSLVKLLARRPLHNLIVLLGIRL